MRQHLTRLLPTISIAATACNARFEPFSLCFMREPAHDVHAMKKRTSTHLWRNSQQYLHTVQRSFQIRRPSPWRLFLHTSSPRGEKGKEGQGHTIDRRIRTERSSVDLILDIYPAGPCLTWPYRRLQFGSPAGRRRNNDGVFRAWWPAATLPCGCFLSLPAAVCVTERYRNKYDHRG